jgi:hypothetical protein
MVSSKGDERGSSNQEERLMKRVKNGTRVLMGNITTGTYSGSENRIQLFDGKFTTGFRVVDFQIAGDFPMAADDLSAVISTEPLSALGQWDWSDVQQVAWSSALSFGAASIFDHRTILRPDNMAIEDLWINSYTTGEQTVMNYKIILEKYTFAAWDGAGILVENLSQAGPS